MNSEKWIKENLHPLKNKRVAVTGSTGGLGKELCAYLASLGAQLVLLDRNAERSKAHADAICERYPEITVERITLDLEDIVSADAAVRELAKLGVDIFIHNAGAYSIPRHICTTGYENVFQINFATPYYMIKKLLPHLRERGGRVIAVGSIAHNYSHIDGGDTDFRTRKAASKVYGNAKRYLMFGLHELMKDEGDVRFSVAHPGITFTNITAHYPKPVFAVIKYPMKVIFMKPSKAALSILKGTCEDTEYCTWIGPRIFDVWGLPKKRRLNTCSAEESERIAVIAEDVYSQCERTVAQKAQSTEVTKE